MYFALKANAIGRSAKTVREFLEKHYTDDVVCTEKETIKLALKALLEVVQSGSKNMEVAIMRKGEGLKVSFILCCSVNASLFTIGLVFYTCILVAFNDILN